MAKSKTKSSFLVPDGYYEGQVCVVEIDNKKTAVQFGTAKTGNPQVAVHFEITSGEFAGRRLPWIGYFTDDSWDRTMESLELAGFTGDLETFHTQKPSATVSLAVETQEYEGKIRSRVAWVNDPTKGVLKIAAPLDDKTLKALGSRLKLNLSKKKKSASGEKIPF